MMLLQTLTTIFVRRHWCVFIIIGLGILLYGKTLGYQLVLDDRTFLFSWPAIQIDGDIGALLRGDLPGPHQGVYRPVRSLLYLLSFTLWGQQLFFYHAQAVLLHLSLSVLVYVLGFVISRKRWVGFLAAAVFVSHPEHVGAVAFITASMDLFSLCFLMLAFILLVRFFEGQYQNVLLLLGAFGLALLATFSGEFALTFPLLIGCYSVIFRRTWVKTDMRYIALFLIPIAAYVLIRYVVLGIHTRSGYLNGDMIGSLLLSVIVLATHIGQFVHISPNGLIHVLPGGFNNFPNLNQNQIALMQLHLFDRAVVGSLIVILMVFWFAYVGRHKSLWIPFGVGWIVVSLLPSLQLVPGSLIFSERYAYLATIGFSWVLVGVYEWLSNSRPNYKLLAQMLLVGFVGMSAFLTVSYTKQWENNIVFWTAEVSRNPGNNRALLELSFSLKRGGRLDEAITTLRRLQLQDSTNTTAYHLLADIYIAQNKHFDRIALYDQLLLIDPTNTEVTQLQAIARIEAAQALIGKGDYVSARALVEKAHEVLPDYGPANDLLDEITAYNK